MSLQARRPLPPGNPQTKRLMEVEVCVPPFDGDAGRAVLKHSLHDLSEGYPVDGCAEWSSYYGGAGTVFNLTWSSPQTVSIFSSSLDHNTDNDFVARA